MKQEFIEFIEKLFKETNYEIPENVKNYWDAFKNITQDEKPVLTDNGKIILKYLQENQNIPIIKAKEIAEALFISSRTVSGAMRKLVTDGFVDKVGQDPVIYSITEKGKTIEIN